MLTQIKRKEFLPKRKMPTRVAGIKAKITSRIIPEVVSLPLI
jgi:hypothetical protein